MPLFHQIEKRFGTVAVDKGYITTAQLIEALSIQHREYLARSARRPMGQVLLDLGYMNATQIRVVLDQMGLPLALFHLLIKSHYERALPAAQEAAQGESLSDNSNE